MSYTTKVSLPHTELIVGRSGSGKTHYLLKQLESILKHNDTIRKVYIICPTIDNNKAYKTWKLPSQLSRKVQYIGCHQDAVNEELLEILGSCKSPQNRGDEDTLRNIIVLDDCAQGKDIKGRTSPIVTLAFGARHYGIATIVITQQLTSITKPFRDNVTRLVTFYIHSAQGTKILYDEFMGDTPRLECLQIQKALKTERYRHLVLNLGFPYTYELSNSNK